MTNKVVTTKVKNKKTTVKAKPRNFRFANFLRKCRVDAGFKTQGEVATRLGVHYTVISNYETGTGYPSEENAKKLAEIYNIKYEDMVKMRGKVRRTRRTSTRQLDLNFNGDERIAARRIKTSDIDLDDSFNFVRQYYVMDSKIMEDKGSSAPDTDTMQTTGADGKLMKLRFVKTAVTTQFIPSRANIARYDLVKND